MLRRSDAGAHHDEILACGHVGGVCRELLSRAPCFPHSNVAREKSAESRQERPLLKVPFMRTLLPASALAFLAQGALACGAHTDCSLVNSDGTAEGTITVVEPSGQVKNETQYVADFRPDPAGFDVWSSFVDRTGTTRQFHVRVDGLRAGTTLPLAGHSKFCVGTAAYAENTCLGLTGTVVVRTLTPVCGDNGCGAVLTGTLDGETSWQASPLTLHLDLAAGAYLESSSCGGNDNSFPP